MTKPKLRFYYDTETTGFPRTDGAPLAEQPYIVQLAAILVDDALGELACLNTIIQPTDWEVSSGAANVHGITTEKARLFGIPIASALSVFSQLLRRADQAIAHNDAFDIKLITYELNRLNKPNILLEKPRFCTMNATTDICKLPGRYGKYKWPKLQEAYKHFFGEDFDSAHDALADVRACARVHRHLLQNQLIPDHV